MSATRTLIAIGLLAALTVGAWKWLKAGDNVDEGFAIVWSHEHEAAVEVIRKAAGDSEGNASTLLAAISAAAELLPDNILIQKSLQMAKTANDASSIRKRMLEIKTSLEFQPTVESPLPKGFPSPTPVGTIQIQKYPVYRWAVATTPDSDGAFWTLFTHIQKQSIAMTAPVEMLIDEKVEKSSRQRRAPFTEMAFLYRNTDLGNVGADGNVTVSDHPEVQAVSIGLTGDANEAAVELAVGELRNWLTRQTNPDGTPKHSEDGPPRVFGYNSPFIPYAKRYFEVQIPITNGTEPATQDDSPSPATGS